MVVSMVGRLVGSSAKPKSQLLVASMEVTTYRREPREDPILLPSPGENTVPPIDSWITSPIPGRPPDPEQDFEDRVVVLTQLVYPSRLQAFWRVNSIVVPLTGVHV